MGSEYDRVFALKDEGKSKSQVGDLCGMDRRKVKGILESLTNVKEYHPYSLIDKSKWPDIKRRIEELHEINNEVTISQVIDDIKEKYAEKIGAYCVSQVRESSGLIRKQRKYGHFVREANRPKRVEWAPARKAEKEMFSNVFFADEASVEIDNKTSFVWVKACDPYAHIAERPKHPQRVMIWLAISMMGPAEIKIVGPRESFKSEDYCKVLEDFYLPAATALYGGYCRLAHDNAPVHMSAFTKTRMAEIGVEVMPWPAESPDMMPVELAFAYMKERLRSHYKPKNKAELIESILKFKDDFLTPKYCQDTIRHIHKAMNQVIDREGFPVRGSKD
ncbi:hypothetical protein PENTCL1PPCAC_24012 [Pristionchus entomophagus]|uniref:Tc1-like transposase DDE domain-containing protein n=2 Tax=Pristionchus entomophagus TaxID=358040 RepID=A0AAV5U630_9BILA|nr:hypothetical protein PENTCL1PPCAC_24012 [Pristionchus entomophagus]